MKTQKFFVEGQIPGLNDLLAAKGSGFGKGNAYARLKKEWTEKIHWAILRAKIQPVQAAGFHFYWQELHMRRDPDNVAAGGRKLILDALVKAGTLPNDGWAEIRGFQDTFSVNKDYPGVWVHLTGAIKGNNTKTD